MSDLESVSRRKRVNTLKKLIILLLVTLLVIPIVMCVLMFVRMTSLEKELREMHTQIDQIAFEQSKYRETQHGEHHQKRACADQSGGVEGAVFFHCATSCHVSSVK